MPGPFTTFAPSRPAERHRERARPRTKAALCASAVMLLFPGLSASIAVAQQPFAKNLTLVVGGAAGITFVTPPGRAPSALATMRAAFEATYQDQAFLNEAATMKLDINPLGGAKVAGLIDRMYAAPRSVVDGMSRALRPSGS